MNHWPKYQSNKIVQAAKIVSFDWCGSGRRICARIDPGNDDIDIFQPSETVVLDKASVGDYAVIYADGYKSISPAATFEDGYVKI